MRVNTDIISDQGGETIGKVSNYVSKFKKIDSGEEVSYVPESNSVRERIVIPPAEWNTETEKEILTHYYRRLGDHTCTDFQEVSSKLAANVNRLFRKQFTPEDIVTKLEASVTIEDVSNYAEKSQLPGKKESPKVSKVKLNLKEDTYKFIKERPALTPEYLDLIPYVDSSNICFSSDGYSIYLATSPGCEKCFDNLFDFSPREEIVFQMFKEQLGDEIKAKKLVLMSKLLNDSTQKEIEEVKEVKKINTTKKSGKLNASKT